MIALIESIFGEYTPLIDPVTGSVVYGVAGVDWPWIAGVALFGICLISFFKILGVVMKH